MILANRAPSQLGSALGESLEDELPSFCRLLKHERSGETQDAEASLAELAVAPGVRSAAGWLGVIRTVDFNDELGRRTVEVDDARAEQHDLAPKPSALLPSAELPPERDFRAIGIRSGNRVLTRSAPTAYNA